LNNKTNIEQLYREVKKIKIKTYMKLCEGYNYEYENISIKDKLNTKF